MLRANGIDIWTVSSYTGKYRSFQLFKCVEYESLGSSALTGGSCNALKNWISYITHSAETWEISKPQ